MKAIFASLLLDSHGKMICTCWKGLQCSRVGSPLLVTESWRINTPPHQSASRLEGLHANKIFSSNLHWNKRMPEVIFKKSLHIYNLQNHWFLEEWDQKQILNVQNMVKDINNFMPSFYSLSLSYKTYFKR